MGGRGSQSGSWSDTVRLLLPAPPTPAPPKEPARPGCAKGGEDARSDALAEIAKDLEFSGVILFK